MAIELIKSLPVPEQVAVSGKPAKINMAQFFIPPDDALLTYSAERLPPGLTIEKNTGVITGSAIEVPVATPFLVSVTAQIADSDTATTEYFALTIMPKDVPEITANEQAATSEKKATTNVESWRLHEWIEFIIREHYACIYFFNGAYPQVEYGGQPQISKDSNGYSIYIFNNYIVLGMGDNAFMEGNRGRIIRSIETLYKQQIAQQKWPAIGIIATDETTLAKAWVMGRKLGMPVSEIPPNDSSLLNYRNIARLQGLEDLSWPNPTPQ